MASELLGARRDSAEGAVSADLLSVTQAISASSADDL